MFKTFGIVAALVYLIVASQMGGFAPGFPAFFLTLLVLISGIIAVAGITAPTEISQGAMKKIRETLPLSHEKLMEELQEIAAITRRDGLLALEVKRKELADPLLKVLLKRIVEGFDKTQTLPLLRNQAMRRAELIRTCEVYVERVLGLVPVVGLIPSLFILIEFLAHSEKGESAHSLPVVFFPFLASLLVQVIGTAWMGRVFDEVKESVKLYYLLMEEGMLGLHDGSNAEVLKDRMRARFVSVPEWAQN